MFTKKLEDQFSADLLNTVRSILGEAKHDKECECEKCEKEEDETKSVKEETAGKKDSDIPFEGPYKKVGERKDRYGNVVKNVAKHLAKKAMAKEEVEQIDELSVGKLSKYISATHQRGKEEKKKRAKGLATAVDKISYPKGSPLAKKVPATEEVQIDELSKKTLGSYIKKAAGDVGKEALIAGLKVKSGENPTKNLNKSLKRQKGIETASSKLTKEEQDFIDSLNNELFDEITEAEKNLTGLSKSTAEKNKQYIEVTHLLGHKKRVPVHPTNAFKALNRYRKDPSTKSARIVSEEVELEEGRGRPPKEGSAAWHAKQKQDNDDMPALGMQLRKAKSMNKKVRFMNGKEHEIHPNHINRFEDHMAARKTSQEKAAFQKQAHKSHDDFVKAVSAPVPKASKDTGEIVKYRH